MQRERRPGLGPTGHIGLRGLAPSPTSHFLQTHLERAACPAHRSAPRDNAAPAPLPHSSPGSTRQPPEPVLQARPAPSPHTAAAEGVASGLDGSHPHSDPWAPLPLAPTLTPQPREGPQAWQLLGRGMRCREAHSPGELVGLPQVPGGGSGPTRNPQPVRHR